MESLEHVSAGVREQYIQEMFKDFDFVSEDNIIAFIKIVIINYETSLQSKLSLPEYFKHINSKEHHQIDYGAYLVGDFKLDTHRGADVMSIWWYNRNLRMFRNIQEITGSKDDRLLLIIGNGHCCGSASAP